MQLQLAIVADFGRPFEAAAPITWIFLLPRATGEMGSVGITRVLFDQRDVESGVGAAKIFRTRCAAKSAADDDHTTA